jgi:hypothetical protein
MPNKFAAALKKEKVEPKIAAPGNIQKTGPSKTRPSRKGAKHVGGYFDPVVSKQLRAIALDEDISLQALLGEAFDMLFQSRGKPMIARKNVQ